MGLLNFLEHPIQGVRGLLGGYGQPQDGGDYFDQNLQLIGNGGDASRPYSGSVPHQVRQAPSGQPGGLGSFLRIPGAIGSAILDDLQSGPRATQQEAQIRQQIMATVSDPQERAVAMANPTAWAKEKATLGGYHGINGGDVGVFGNPMAGGSVMTAPKYGVTEGRGYSIGPGGLQSMGELDPSFGQVTARQNADTQGSGFTLGPGARRYGPDGKVIAESPFAPQYRNVGPGDRLVEVGAPGAAPPQSAAAMLAILPPGSRVTSTARTPQHNAEVGGVPNSHHLNGSAIDFIPPKGVTLDQVKQQYAAAGVQLTEALDEGDHFHIAWAAPGGAGAGGSRVVAEGGPKESSAPNGYRYKADGSLEYIPGGPADPAVSANTKNLKPVPVGAKTSYVGNNQALKNIDRAIAAVQANPEAFGAANYTPLQIRDRLPGKGANGGVSARAVVAQISSQKIHDLSGAAVTATEFPRLRPFIPLATDRADVVLDKLQNMRMEYQQVLEQTEAAYGPDSGYRPINQPDAQPPAPAAKGPPLKGPAPGTVKDGYRFKGGNPGDPKSWVKL